MRLYEGVVDLTRQVSIHRLSPWWVCMRRQGISLYRWVYMYIVCLLDEAVWGGSGSYSTREYTSFVSLMSLYGEQWISLYRWVYIVCLLDEAVWGGSGSDCIGEYTSFVSLMRLYEGVVDLALQVCKHGLSPWWDCLRRQWISLYRWV